MTVGTRRELHVVRAARRSCRANCPTVDIPPMEGLRSATVTCTAGWQGARGLETCSLDLVRHRGAREPLAIEAAAGPTCDTCKPRRTLWR